MGYTNFPNGITSNGVPVFGDLGFGVGNIKRLVTAKAGATDAYYKLMSERGVSDNDIFTTLATGEAALTTNRNDALLMYPGAHTATAAVTWNVGNTALIGAHAYSPWSNSTKITFSGSGTALSPILTVSGSDVLMKSIHFVDSCSHVDHHNFLLNSGSGNMYQNCWFEGPTDGTVADDTSMKLVIVDGGGNYFNSCIFGTTACATAGAALLGWTGSCYRSTFQDCIFYHQHDAAGGIMLDLNTAFDISGPQFFKGCQFVGWSNNWATKATVLIRRTGSSASTGGLIFDPDCMVVGFTDISSGNTVGEAPFFFGLSFTTTFDGTYSGIIEHATAG